MSAVNFKKINNSFLENQILEISLGNKDALTNLYNETKHAVYGFALSLVKNIHDAEDVLQEVYIKIYDNASGYANEGKALNWILMITKNLSLMKLRTKKYHEDIDELCETLRNNYSDVIENKILIDTIFNYISDEERNILILHSVVGFKHREISQMLNIPIATVLSKYNRLIKKIKKRIGEE